MSTRKSPLWVPERAEVIFIQYNPQVGKEMPNDHPMLVMSMKAFAVDWRQRNARPHPWGTGHTKLLGSALKRFDTVFAVCDH